MLNEAIAGLNKARENCASVYKMLAFQLGFVSCQNGSIATSLE